MNKTRLLAIVVVVAAIVLGIGAVSAFATLADDATPPVTTSSVAATYAGDVAFDVSSTDAEGVAYIYHRFDNGVERLYTVATDTVHASVSLTVPTAKDLPLSLGTHSITFWAQDNAGNVEKQTTATFVVNPALTLKGSAAVVSASKYFTLSGVLKPAAVGKVVIQAKKPGASAFKTLTSRTTDAAGVYSYRYRTPTKGTWSFRTQFTDAKTASSATSAIAKVRIK